MIRTERLRSVFDRARRAFARGERSTTEPSAGRARSAVVTALLMVGGCLLVYFPYDPAGFPGRTISWYVELQARLVGTVLRWFDATVTIDGHHIGGCFPLDIVADCAALDALVLFAAGVVGFPARLSRKLVGVVAGVAVIVVVNLARIVTLWLAGVFRPAIFDLLHEEVLQIAMVATALGAFLVWARWTVRPARVEAHVVA